MVDRRVARTRALLQQAHLALIVERGYEATTVEDICDRANVGRSTFYAHYTGKEDLHRRGLEALRHELGGGSTPEAGTADGQPRLRFSLPMFEHARSHLDLYRALTGSRGGVMAVESIRRLLCDLVAAELPALGIKAGSEERAFIVQYLVGAYLAVLTTWLDGGAQIEPAEMDAMFQSLAFGGLGAWP